VAGGAVGAWLAARQLGIPFPVIADALAPGLPLAQAVGRLGNWFNNELYGGRTTLPWGLEVHVMDPDNPGHALRDDAGNPVLQPGLYHPTFLYEALWNVGVAALVLYLDRKLRLGRGRAFALYVMGYTAGRFWIELMRTDEANLILGVRLNVWTAVLVFLGALAYFVRVRGPREYLVPVGEPAAAPTPSGDVSQVDLSAREAAARPAPPEGYRVVSEEQFDAYRKTGVLPPVEPAADDDRPETPDGATDGDAEQADRTDTDPAATDGADADGTDADPERTNAERTNAGRADAAARPTDRDS